MCLEGEGNWLVGGREWMDWGFVRLRAVKRVKGELGSAGTRGWSYWKSMGASVPLWAIVFECVGCLSLSVSV